MARTTSTRAQRLALAATLALALGLPVLPAAAGERALPAAAGGAAPAHGELQGWQWSNRP